MKQSELDKQLRFAAKTQAKERGLRSVGGMPYWESGPLLFMLVISASAKERVFFASLRFKWLLLDNVLWRVLDMESNEKAPFSLHVNGAFSLSGTELLSQRQNLAVWSADVVESELGLVVDQAIKTAVEVGGLISTLESYIAFIKHKHAELIARHPRAVVTTWAEELLAAMLASNTGYATRIAEARIAARDSGGYVSGGLSLYQRALRVLELPPNNSFKRSPQGVS